LFHEIETELLDDDVARVLLSCIVKGNKTGRHDIDIVAQATAHCCHDSDLEAPIAIHTFDATTPLHRDSILTHLARYGLEVKAGVDCL
jgi:hypothetical protein